MPKIDLSFTITAIIAICALISPIFTTIINNHHQKKIKELEYQMEIKEKENARKKQIIEDYLRSASTCANVATLENRTNYCNCYSAALLYVPDKVMHQMVYVHDFIVQGKSQDADSIIIEIAMMLRNQNCKL